MKARVLIGLAAVGGALALGACHPVSADSTAGRPVPPADAPSDGASAAPAGADTAVSDLGVD